MILEFWQPAVTEDESSRLYSWVPQGNKSPILDTIPFSTKAVDISTSKVAFKFLAAISVNPLHIYEDGKSRPDTLKSTPVSTVGVVAIIEK